MAHRRPTLALLALAPLAGCGSDDVEREAPAGPRAIDERLLAAAYENDERILLDAGARP